MSAHVEACLFETVGGAVVLQGGSRAPDVVLIVLLVTLHRCPERYWTSVCGDFLQYKGKIYV